ncbi:MAG: HAD family hydrolase [Verrucomicrobiia bacterium]|jgi:phosphoglycolate phosphatase
MIRPPATSIELLPGFTPRPEISNVVFDFDGTLSVLRQGWQNTILEMFQELLPPVEGEDASALENELFTEILSFNGRQPIHQMRAFSDRVRQRGGDAQTGEQYLTEYAGRLRIGINKRIARVESGVAAPDEYVVFGARVVLDWLTKRGLRLTLLSGTNEEFVRQELDLLGLTQYFNAGIYGGTKDPAGFSKEAVYERVMRGENISAKNLMSVGDGPVEIRCNRDLGGLAIAVASAELDNGSGRVHEAKRSLLVAAGADVVIPDYRDGLELMKLIFE